MAPKFVDCWLTSVGSSGLTVLEACGSRCVLTYRGATRHPSAPALCVRELEWSLCEKAAGVPLLLFSIAWPRGKDSGVVAE